MRAFEEAAKKDAMAVFGAEAQPPSTPRGKGVYSFGEDSPAKFIISDKLARNYNSAAETWLKAQVRFNQKFGRPWNPETHPVQVHWNRRQRKAWGQMAKLLAEVSEKDGPFHANDFMDDFLVRNNVPAPLRRVKSAGRIIAIGVALGVLSGLLKGQSDLFRK